MLDEVLTPEERAVVARARAFADEHVAPNAARWEWERRYPLETIKAACAAGLNTIELAKQHGGQGLSFSCKLRAFEEIAKADFAFAFALINHHNACRPLCPRRQAGACRAPAAAHDHGRADRLRRLERTRRRQRLRRAGNDGGEGRGRLEAERRQGLDHQRRGGRPLGGLRPDRQGAGLSRHRLLRHRSRAAGLPARQAVRAAWRPRDRRRRLPSRRLFRAGRGACCIRRARPSRRRWPASTARATYVAAMCCGMLQASLETAVRYTQRAQDLRPAGDRPSGRALEAGRCRDRSRGGAAADLSRGAPDRRGRRCRAAGGPCQEVRDRDGACGASPTASRRWAPTACGPSIRWRAISPAPRSRPTPTARSR